MLHRLCVVGTLLLSSALFAADPTPESYVRTMTVTPAGAPVPALRYHLLPEVRDTSPGNAALLYYRAFAPEWSSSVRSNKELQEKINQALDKTPAEVAAMPELIFLRNWSMLKEVDRAARRAYCDWEMAPRVREDGARLLLPDLQGIREFARYLKIRCKLELANRQFGSAIQTLQTGMQLGKHVSDNPTLIQALVGIAITAVSLSEVEDWIQTPGSPNLYWALTTLPQPYIDLRKSYEGERLFMDNLFPGFREALADPSKPPAMILPEELQHRLQQVVGNSLDSTMYVLAISMRKYSAAKEFLKARGWSKTQIEALSAPTAVMLLEIAKYDELADQMLKWHAQPYWIARPGLEQVDRELKAEVTKSGSPGLSLAGYLLPPVAKIQIASARTDRTIQALRTIEALRLYAAAHGAFPDRLDQITEVPVPLDPFTGKQFEYRRSGDRFVLTGPPPAGEQPHRGNAVHYEIRLQK